MRKRTLAMALALAAPLMLGGCWEDPQVTLHEPGEYKGHRDPLLNQQASTRGEQLQKRFQLVQMDR